MVCRYEKAAGEVIILMMTTYTTVQGDMWDSIAYKLYKSESQMIQLMQANPHYGYITTFPAGIVLRVPEIVEQIDNELPPWKQVQS